MSWELRIHHPLFLGTFTENINMLPCELQNYIYEFCNWKEENVIHNIKKKKIQKYDYNRKCINQNKDEINKWKTFLHPDLPFYSIYVLSEIQTMSIENSILNLNLRQVKMINI
jgi:hypothetical protein